MKRIMPLFLACFILLSAAISVSADMIWVPMDDFFPEAYPSCHIADRAYFLAAGEHGYVSAVRSPLDPTVVGIYPNGTVFIMPWVCESGGELWGAVQRVFEPGKDSFSGRPNDEDCYVPLRDLVQAYDPEAFREDHAEELIRFEGEFDLCSTDGFMVWLSPGSGIPIEFVREEYTGYLCDPKSGSPFYHTGASYTDRNGDRWLEITGFMEEDYGWIRPDRLKDR